MDGRAEDKTLAERYSKLSIRESRPFLAPSPRRLWSLRLLEISLFLSLVTHGAELCTISSLIYVVSEKGSDRVGGVFPRAAARANLRERRLLKIFFRVA